MRLGLKELGLNTGKSDSQVIPVIIGSEEAAYRVAGALFNMGILASAITYPAVKYGASRLRLCATASMHKKFIDDILSGLGKVTKKIPRVEYIWGERAI